MSINVMFFLFIISFVFSCVFLYFIVYFYLFNFDPKVAMPLKTLSETLFVTLIYVTLGFIK